MKKYPSFEVEMEAYANSRKMIQACQDGDFPLVKYLVTSPELAANAIVHFDSHKAFLNACSFGHLDIMQFLLNESNLVGERPTVSTIPLLTICINNHYHILNYLFTSTDFCEPIRISEPSAFSYMCAKEDWLMVEYLFEYIDPKSKITNVNEALHHIIYNHKDSLDVFTIVVNKFSSYIDFHWGNDKIFNLAREQGNIPLIHSLVFDYHLTYTDSIKNYSILRPKHNISLYPDFLEDCYIENLFNKRDLKQRIDNLLPPKTGHKKSMKI